MSDLRMIPVDSATEQLLAQCGEVLIDVVQRKFGVRVILHNIKNRSSSRTAQMKGARCSVRLPNGPEVSVWKDNLTTHRVDAVVNAANKYLHHGGGLAGALCRAGGPQIQKMSDEYIKNHGMVDTGTAVCTESGDLPCKAIIHAVGPCVPVLPTPREVEKASILLKCAVESILRLAEEKSFQSVAIPALSSGLFNFPLDSCAKIIVDTVKCYRYSPNSPLSEVHLVNNDEITVSAIERAFSEIQESKASYSGAVQADRTSLSVLSSLQLGNVTMHIKKGHIEQEKVDVIVNTIPPDRDLANGRVSEAILKKAGHSIQYELRQSKHNSEYGEVIETRGCLLQCSKVYHTVCASNNDGRAQGSKILREAVRKCLDKAAKGKYSSISFPAIGTGTLGFSAVEVAKLMIEEVANFAKQQKGQKMDVYFVLYPADEEAIKAFQQEMLCVKEKQPVKFRSTARKGGQSGPSGSSEHGRATIGEQACIELCNSSEEEHREAKRWIHDILYLTKYKCTIVDNHILLFGQKEHEKLLSLQAADLSIQEFLHNGLAGVTIAGPQLGVREAALRVEALCCEAQEEFCQTEESAMVYTVVRWRCAEFREFEEPEITGTLERARLAGRDTLTVTVNGRDLQVSIKKMEAKDPMGRFCRIERICLYKDMDLKFPNGAFYQRTVENLKTTGNTYQAPLIDGLVVVKIEKVKNPLLEHHFQQKQKQVSGSAKCLYQPVPAQFCDLVCRVGFQRHYSPPKEQSYGAGIYFGDSVSTAKKLAERLENEEYIYIFEAQVLTGRDTYGSSDLIIPPALGSDPLCRYDSVKGYAQETHVIFNSHQALPVYLITYRKTNTVQTRHM
ncbi:hypothetical protein SKAU_G00256070 [Synaphobranchus kaupii]|uniref:Macro domain-containing protein n=1 Tax=Synaphobranchus kaupii TaxID=118154 RepID=A0A9Q1F462_SYNKA|nr:hypothetical protein SKAU_G00256070 [Synaphobranchus kaupii]